MNAHVRIALEEYARQAGAVVPCEICGNRDLSAGDDDSERRAYAMATNAWKAGEFRTTSLDDVKAEMKSVLLAAPSRCPSCG